MTYQYDTMGRVTDLTYSIPSGTAREILHYEYSALTGQLTRDQRTSADPNFNYLFVNGYHVNNRITSRSATESLIYDGSSNIKEVWTWMGLDNHMLENNAYDFTYDDEGNRTAQQSRYISGTIHAYNAAKGSWQARTISAR